MTPASAQALERIFVASSSKDRPLMLVDGSVNTDDRVATSTADALRARGLIELWTQHVVDGPDEIRAAITPAGVEVVAASRRRRASR